MSTNNLTTESRYNLHYGPAKFPNYTTFTYSLELDHPCLDVGGIPRRVALLHTIDIANSHLVQVYPLQIRAADLLELHHVKDYLVSPDFSVDRLTSQRYDNVFFAIISFVLQWDEPSLTQLCHITKRNPTFVQNLIAHRNLDNGRYIYNVEGIPVSKMSLKLIRSLFVERPQQQQLVKSNPRIYRLSEHVPNDFWVRLHEFENKVIVQNDKLSESELAWICEDNPKTPITITICDDQQPDKEIVVSAIKFITGMACCGKTSLLTELSKLGWVVLSRGAMGSFGAKTECCATVGVLHGTLDFMLSKPDVVGDRGAIDNIIWKFIMEHCDPKYKGRLVDRFIEFLDRIFPEMGLVYFMQQRGIVFLDMDFEANRQRMRRRNCDGDAYRSRLKYYAACQWITYLTVAKLFNWKIFLVPYDQKNRFEPARYSTMVNEIHNYLLDTNVTSSLSENDIKKPVPSFIQNYTIHKNYNPTNIADMSYPKSVGIYK